MHYKNNKGFTLVELILVINIVLIIAVAFLTISNERSKRIAINNLFKTLKTIVDNYYIMNLSLPDNSNFQDVLKEYSIIYKITNPYFSSTEGISIIKDDISKKYTLIIKKRNGVTVESRTYDYPYISINEYFINNQSELFNIYSVILAYR